MKVIPKHHLTQHLPTALLWQAGKRFIPNEYGEVNQ